VVAARAAYQVGVLKAIRDIRRQFGAPTTNPFPIIVGTSAGAINAAGIACHADCFDLAVAHLVDVWREFSAEQIYRADALGVIRSGARWLTLLTAGWAIARWRRLNPRSLLDKPSAWPGCSRPCCRLRAVPEVMRAGHLQALAVSCLELYVRAPRDVLRHGWKAPPRGHAGSASPSRARSRSPTCSPPRQSPSSSPAAPLTIAGRTEWFGDGSMRQVAPISPAIHLGAERVLVIEARRMKEPPGDLVAQYGYPSLAQIAGHALSSMFLDALPADIERLRRINRTLAPAAGRNALAVGVEAD